MDLSTLDTTTISEQGAVMELRHPTTGAVLMQDDGETPVSITLAGMDSTRFRRQQRINQDRRLKGQRRGVNSEEMENDNLDLLVACFIEWSGIKWDGQLQVLTPATAKALLKRWAWAREQVDAFMGERANFLTTSETNS